MKSKGRGVLDRPVKPDDDSCVERDKAIINVVPAKAGTHNHRSSLEQKAVSPSCQTPSRGAAMSAIALTLGSLRSQGRLVDTSRI